jgi:hypothetical protein
MAPPACGRDAERFRRTSGAGKESRTLDLNLGKVALYQLSYSRIKPETIRHRRKPVYGEIKKEAVQLPFEILEREKSLELSTSTLARLRSTN